MSVQISGLGAICANGLNPETIYQSCLKGESTVEDTGLSSIRPEIIEQLRSKTPEKLRASKATVLGFHSLQQALQDSKWSDSQIQKAGFIFATTTGKIDLWEKVLCSYEKLASDSHRYHEGLIHQPLGAPLTELSEYFHVSGPQAQISSSCSASLQALAMAYLWIESGKVDRCLVGTTEIHNDLTRVGFNSLRLLSKSVCTPFDKNRTGINLGEGAAFICLEKNIQKTPSPWGFMRGIGLSSDAFHPTSPHPEGRGSYIAMKKAVESAKLQTSQVDWVYAHGTGSPANDQAEAQAVQLLFPHKPFVTSTKSLHGHTLGSCGIIESVIGLQAMKNNVVLSNSNLKEVDPLISLNLPVKNQDHKIRHFLKNSLGFGGINVSIVFSQEAPE